MLFVLIFAAWLGISVLVLAVCRVAARGDASIAQAAPEASAQQLLGTLEPLDLEPLEEAAYNPRRPTTCGTVRSNILTSVHNDQLAT